MYLGIDLGTSALKALLIDADQRVVASATGALAVDRPHPGWSEQDPARWTRAAEVALDHLKCGHGAALGAVRGIGLAGQMHGASLLDRADKVLRPAILWNDTRAHEEAARLDALPEFRAITGNIVFPGFTAPKLVWVRRHEPELFARTAKVLLPKDHLRLWLTGEHVSDMSDAAGTGWLDTGARDWSARLLELGGMDAGQMPRLVEGTAVSGTLRPDLAARWGLGPGVAVAGGGGDNAASAVGIGAIGSGAAFISLGTSGVLFAATAAYRPNPESAVHTFCHAVPRAWHQMGVILAAGDALAWFSRLTGAAPEALAAELGERLRPPGAISFLPYLAGERTPHNDARIRGAFAGLDHGADRPALTHAVLAGVAFALGDCLEVLRGAGTGISSAIAVGGGSRSRYWLKLIATVLGVRVEVPAAGDFGAAFGAARLGLVAAEGADPEAVCRPPPIAETIAPESALVSAYHDAWHRYRALYPALKGALP